MLSMVELYRVTGDEYFRQYWMDGEVAGGPVQEEKEDRPHRRRDDRGVEEREEPLAAGE